MNKQELIDETYRRLVAQGGPSTYGGGKQCAYRGADGRKCAVGLWIKDKDYTPKMEGMRPGRPLIADAVSYLGVSTTLLHELQLAHDGAYIDVSNGVAPWSEALRAQMLRHGFKVSENVL